MTARTAPVSLSPATGSAFGWAVAFGLLLTNPVHATTLTRADVGPEDCRWLADSVVWENRGGSDFPTLAQVAGAFGLSATTEAEAAAALCAKATATDGLDCKATPPVVGASGLTIVLPDEHDWAIVFRTASGGYALHRGLHLFSIGREDYVAVPAAAGGRYRVVVQQAENYVRVECDSDDDPDCRPATSSEGFFERSWLLDTETGRVVLSDLDERDDVCPSWGTAIIRGDLVSFPACGDALRPTETHPAVGSPSETAAGLWFSFEFVEGCQDGGVAAAQARARALSPDERKRATAAVTRGRALTKKKRYSDAIAAFDEAVEIDPSQAEAYSGRGYARLLDGALGDAKADFESALALTFGETPEAKAFRKRVRFNLDEVDKRLEAEDR